MTIDLDRKIAVVLRKGHLSAIGGGGPSDPDDDVPGSSLNGDVDELARFDGEACQEIVEVAGAIRARGMDCPLVSIGSTATSRFDTLADGITEVRPGMYVFNDASVVKHGHATWEQTAVWVVATVVSRPGPDRAVVDAGSKVLSSDPPHYGGAKPSNGRLMK